MHTIPEVGRVYNFVSNEINEYIADLAGSVVN